MIKLINDDCLKAMDKLISDGVVVDAIITDPPYNIGKSKCWDKWKSVEEYVEFMGNVFSRAEIILKESQDNRRKHKWLTVKK